MRKDRVPFSKDRDFISMPNMIKHQLDSYDDFLKEGMKEVLDQVFPIQDREKDNSYRFEYVDYRVEPPKISPKYAKKKDLSYNGELYIKFRLHDNLMGGTIKESEVFYGEIPYITDSGSFIVNGNERVVVSQMVKAPSLYFDSSINDKGKTLYEGVVQPDRGSRIYLTTDARDEAWVRIDKRNKILLTIFLKALGFENNDEIRETFGEENKYIKATLDKDKTETREEAIIEFYKVMRPGEPIVMERAEAIIESTFFDFRRYDLDFVGRYKLNQKLNLKQRVIKKTLGEDTNGFKAGDRINDELVESLKEPKLTIQTKDKRNITVIGNGTPDPNVRTLTKQDIISIVNYFIYLDDGIGNIDDIDHLSNRYLRLVGKIFQKEFLAGMRRVEKNIKDRLIINASGYKKDEDELTPEKLAYTKPMEAKFKEFLGSSQLSQYVDQINPLGELSNKRRTTAIGPGGFSKERAGVQVRDVNATHFGRICPIETPEGASVGLINQLSSYAEVNKYGFLVSPYRKTKNGKATDEIVYLGADDEENYYLAEATVVDDNGNFTESEVLVKYGDDYLNVPSQEVDFVSVSTKQPFGIGACCIPFLENDDAARVLMGANMQRQGIPVISPEEPLIGTGLEEQIAKDSGSSIFAEEAGVVVDIDEDCIVIKEKKGKERRYELNKFVRTNDSTCWNHYARCYVGKKVKKGDLIADSTSSNNGEIAVGQNVTVAFMPMEGYNFEDSIVISDRIVKNDLFSVVMIEEKKINVRRTKMGPELITRDIPNVGEKQKANLDEEGIIKIGSYVKGGDILVGKKTPKLKEEKSPEDRLLESLYVGKPDDFRDNSLKLDPNETEKIVIDIVRNQQRDMDLKKGILEEIKIYLGEKRKIETGDKMAGRHGNKGVVSVVRPEEDMPHLEDGTPVDMVLNPLGVPSRMNIGQIMEVHLGMVAKMLGVKFEVPVFGGVDSKEEIEKILKENNLPVDGKFQLFDGKTGEPYENKVTVGVMYMMKLNHQVKDKRHARSIGPYSLITQQPLGGKAQNGGQRFGEMEVWALQAYGAANLLQELMTLKSDDFIGRSKLFKSLVKGQTLPDPNLTESLKLLLNEVKALGLDTDIVTKDGKELLKPRYKPERVVLEGEEGYMEEEEDLEIDEELDDDDDSLDGEIED